MRRLDATSAQLASLAAQMQTDRDRADLRFVPRGEWVEARRADQGLVKDVAKDVDELKTKDVSNANSRRQFLFGLALTAVSSLAALVTALAVLFLGKG
jgi:hypothetical protein